MHRRKLLLSLGAVLVVSLGVTLVVRSFLTYQNPVEGIATALTILGETRATKYSAFCAPGLESSIPPEATPILPPNSSPAGKSAVVALTANGLSAKTRVFPDADDKIVVESPWGYSAEYEALVPPTVFDGDVFIYRYSPGGTWGNLVALDGSTARASWSRTEYQSPSPLLVTDRFVYVTQWGPVEETTDCHYLVAVDRKNGLDVWRFRTGSWGAMNWPSEGAVLSSGRIIVNDGASLLALDPDTGTLIWRTQINHWIGGIAATDDAIAIVGGTTTTLLNPGTGATLWQVDAPNAPPLSQVAISGTQVIALGSKYESSAVFKDNEDINITVVLAFNLVDGMELWSSDFPTHQISAPLFGEDTVAFTDLINDRLVALSAIDGNVRWTYDGALTSPAIIGGKLFVVAKAQSPDPSSPGPVQAIDLISIDPLSGELLRRFTIPGETAEGLSDTLVPLLGGWLISHWEREGGISLIVATNQMKPTQAPS